MDSRNRIAAGRRNVALAEGKKSEDWRKKRAMIIDQKESSGPRVEPATSKKNVFLQNEGNTPADGDNNTYK